MRTVLRPLITVAASGRLRRSLAGKCCEYRDSPDSPPHRQGGTVKWPVTVHNAKTCSGRRRRRSQDSTEL